jgi:hypothetical protein
MTITRITPPAVLPISLLEAKAIARLDGNDDDAFIAGLVRTAVDHVEQYLGMSLITSTWQQTEARFPTYDRSIQVDSMLGDIRVGVEKYAHPLHFKQSRDSAVWKLITRMREEDGYGEVQ